MLPIEVLQTMATDHRVALTRSAARHRLVTRSSRAASLRNSVGFFLVRAGFRLARVEGTRTLTTALPAC